MTILHLSLKKKWFDMIDSGEKKEEYREIKPYWNKRFVDKKFDVVQFRNGYSKNSPVMKFKCRGIKVDFGYTCWGAPTVPVYCILLGERL